MATIDEVTGGLKIARKLRGNKHIIGAEHDVIWLHADIVGKHAAKLEELGWFWDENVESWGIFT